ncbi:MAG: helicase-associated domain-containing protein [Ktedonobacteraceae bacterium]
MYDVVPGALQRLREADIVSMAGLMVASLGQEYYRRGAVHATKRQGALLSGIVELSHIIINQDASTTRGALETQQAGNSSPGSFVTEVELRDRISCNVSCSCKKTDAQVGVVCSHAAALLYAWLAHPANFQVAPPSQVSEVPLPLEQEQEKSPVNGNSDAVEMKKTQKPSKTSQAQTLQVSPSSDTSEILAQSGLSELRTIARVYEIPTNGLSKQELAEHIVTMLKQPEAIRKVVASLEKQQRQLLAALTLAGGSMNDEDLRALFERFSLGKPAQLQDMLHILQSKAFIIRATFNSSLQRRMGTGLSGSALEICWYVPGEVRSALHVTLPIAPFNIETDGGQEAVAPKVQHMEPYSLLTDLLLVARALENKWLEYDGRSNVDGSRASGSNVRSLNPLPVDGSISVPAPNGTPSKALLEYLLGVIPRPIAFLRFAIRVLRLADIVYFESDTQEESRNSRQAVNDSAPFTESSYDPADESGPRILQQDKRKNDAGTSILHTLPNAARLLLGSNRAEVAHELFTHWLHRVSYDELFDLQDEVLRLRCRANMMIQPALRSGELELENMDARQTLIRLLSQAPTGQWINFSTFVRFVYRLNPTFLRHRQGQFATPHWWIEQQEGRTLHPTLFGDWMLAEGRYLAQLLQGPLYWWGICDVALSPDDSLLAFQLTPLAQLFLNELSQENLLMLPETQAPGHMGEIDISETGDLSIPCTFANWPFIELIERFAEIKGAQASRLYYRLTPGSLGEAFARGESPVPLLELLQSMADYQHNVAPDGPLARLLVQLERRIASYGRVRFYTNASLLEAADQQVVRELSATTSLQGQTIRAINPTLFILKKNAIEDLFDELKRRGQVPLMHDYRGVPLEAPGTEEQHESK